MAELYLPAPIEGMDLSVPAHALPPSRSPYLRNFLCHNDRVHLRGPASGVAAIPAVLDTAGNAMADEGWMFPIWAGQYTIFRTYGRDGTPAVTSTVDRWWPWEAFEAPDPAATTTQPPTYGRIHYWNEATGTFTGGPAGVIDPHGYGPHVAHYHDAIYALSSGTDSNLYLRYPATTGSGRYHRQTFLIRIGRTPTENPAGAPPAAAGVYLEAPRFAQGLAAFAQRLWVLGGIPSSPAATADTVVGSEITGPTGGTAPRVLKPNTMWFTNINGDPLTDGGWRTSGVANSLVVGTEGSDDYGMGLTPASKFMVIHKKRSTWVLTGSGIDSFAIKQISSTEGLVDPRARITHDDVVYWVSRDGLQSYDGVEVSMLSRAINPLLLPAIQTRSGTSRQSGSYVQLTELPNSYLLLQTGRHKLHTPGTATADAVDRSWLYHIPTGRWSLFETGLYTATRVPTGWFRSGSTHHQLLTTALIDLSDVSNPLLALTANRGNDITEAAASIGYPAECHFVPVRLAAPWERALIRRYGVEAVEEFGVAAPWTGRLQSQIVRYAVAAEDGQEPSGGLTLTSMADLTAGGQQNSADEPLYFPTISPYDVYTEATDVQVRVSRNATIASAVSVAGWVEIIGSYLEWEPTHKRAP